MLFPLPHRPLGAVDGFAAGVGNVGGGLGTRPVGRAAVSEAWFTDLAVEADKGTQVVQIGRSRWEIENEQCKVYKNPGYELEHNYGHGKQTLAMVVYLRNLLAFIAHRILARGDRL